MQASGSQSKIDEILADYERAPIDDKLRAALRLIDKMIAEPEALGPADVKPLLEAGASKQAVADALYVAFLFSIYTQLADTMGWDVPVQGSFDAGAKNLLKRGYKLE